MEKNGKEQLRVYGNKKYNRISCRLAKLFLSNFQTIEYCVPSGFHSFIEIEMENKVYDC